MGQHFKPKSKKRNLTKKDIKNIFKKLGEDKEEYYHMILVV